MGPVRRLAGPDELRGRLEAKTHKATTYKFQVEPEIEYELRWRIPEPETHLRWVLTASTITRHLQGPGSISRALNSSFVPLILACGYPLEAHFWHATGQKGAQG